MFRLVASARTRRSGSLMISRAQLTFSSGTLIWFLRAPMTRRAQLASISSLSASFSTPSRRNGPDFSRGKGASSRTTGSWSRLAISTHLRSFPLREQEETDNRRGHRDQDEQHPPQPVEIVGLRGTQVDVRH